MIDDRDLLPAITETSLNDHAPRRGRPLNSLGRCVDRVERGDELPAGSVVITPSRQIRHPSWKELL